MDDIATTSDASPANLLEGATITISSGGHMSGKTLGEAALEIATPAHVERAQRNATIAAEAAARRQARALLAQDAVRHAANEAQAAGASPREILDAARRTTVANGLSISRAGLAYTPHMGAKQRAKAAKRAAGARA